MKKSILIASILLVSITLTAFGYINWTTPSAEQTETAKTTNCKSAAFDQQMLALVYDKKRTDFFYAIDTRFMPLKKERLLEIESLIELFRGEEGAKIADYHSVKLFVLDDFKETGRYAAARDEQLTDEQIELIQSVKYSDNIKVRADFLEKDKITGVQKVNYASPHFTIVPAQQAEYVYGKAAFVQYLRASSEEIMANVSKDQLKPGKIYFTISADGEITDVNMASSSGYSAIDDKMMELISKAPGEWMPAENGAGEKLDQKLVFSFGIEGC